MKKVLLVMAVVSSGCGAAGAAQKKECEGIAIGTGLESLAQYIPRSTGTDVDAARLAYAKTKAVDDAKGPASDLLCCDACTDAVSCACTAACGAPPASGGSLYALTALDASLGNDSEQICAVWVSADQVVAVWLSVVPG